MEASRRRHYPGAPHTSSGPCGRIFVPPCRSLRVLTALAGSPYPMLQGGSFMAAPNALPSQDPQTAIQRLVGADQKLLDHPGVAHIPSILEQNELLEAITHDGAGKVLAATDRRIIEIETSIMRKSVRKVTSHPYQAILSFEADKGFMATGFSMVTPAGTRRLAAQKGGREEFASVVNARLGDALPLVQTGESPSAVATPLVPDTELPPGALCFAKGINGQATLFEDRIRLERKGAWSFVTYGLRGTKEILISEISSVEYKDAGSVISGYILFLYRGGRDVKSGIFSENSITNNENAVVFVKESQPAFDNLRAVLNERLEEYRRPQQLVVQPASSRLDELKKLGELRDSGIITDDEFESEKARLLSA